MNSVLQDLRYGARLLGRQPGFAVTAAVTLALGVGATTAIFSIVNGVLLAPLPVQESERVVVIWTTSKSTGFDKSVSSYPNLQDWRAENIVFEDMAGVTQGSSTLTGSGVPEVLPTAFVSSSFFPLLRVSPARGRTFSDEEDRHGGAGVVVISDSLWRGRLGGQQDIVGKTVTLDGRPFSVVGVLPSNFWMPSGGGLQSTRVEVFQPLANAGESLTSRGSNLLNVIARLKPGVSVQQAQSNMDSVAAGLAARYPAENSDSGVRLVALPTQVVGEARFAILVLLGAVVFVLLIACINVAGLLLARAKGRQKEIAIRGAIGAGRGRLMRQLLVESVVVGALGAVAGLILASLSLNLLLSLAPADLPRREAIGIDFRVLLFTAGVAVVTSLVFGVGPALRLSKVDLTQELKEGDRGGSGKFGQTRRILVIGQIALSLALLSAGGLLIQSFRKLVHVDPGFDPKGVLSASLTLPETRYSAGDQVVQFFDQALQGIRGLPGVVSAEYVSSVPYSGIEVTGAFIVVGQPRPSSGSSPQASLLSITPGYFETMSIRLKAGRFFTNFDRDGSAGVVIINETAVQRYWQGADPLGTRISFGVDPVTHQPDRRQVVGVVGDVRRVGLDLDPEPEMYLPLSQAPQ
ncbi:MAG TPA: ABC transporter permease, partial [Blastocatellia bacterium]|nr:ABC transporter permease [Blastocatellia bacterium]